jgi:hypothetical protein
MGHW